VLRAYLKGQLPEYMIPAAWVVLGEFPLTPNGKIDRRALPEPEQQPAECGEYIPPRTEMEHVIADIWAQVLQIDQVGVHDNFFDLGGYSLTAISLVGKVAQKLAIELPIHAVFTNPTVQQMAQYVQQLAVETRPSSSGQRDLEEIFV
jgi:acyl carrier protein